MLSCYQYVTDVNNAQTVEYLYLYQKKVRDSLSNYLVLNLVMHHNLTFLFSQGNSDKKM